MNPFTYARAADTEEAVLLGGADEAKYLGGGTNLIDLMRETLERPTSLVDVTGLSASIEEQPVPGADEGHSGRGIWTDS